MRPRVHQSKFHDPDRRGCRETCICSIAYSFEGVVTKIEQQERRVLVLSYCKAQPRIDVTLILSSTTAIPAPAQQLINNVLGDSISIRDKSSTRMHCFVDSVPIVSPG